jgi:hypothetical protein
MNHKEPSLAHCGTHTSVAVVVLVAAGSEEGLVEEGDVKGEATAVSVGLAHRQVPRPIRPRHQQPHPQQRHQQQPDEMKRNKNFCMAHISILRMLTALGVCMQMYRVRPC